MDLRRYLIALVLMAACGSTDESADEGPPTLTELQSEIFTASCAFSTCHAGGAPAAGMSLEAPVHANIVGVESQDAPGKIRIVAGDPDSSYMIEKLTSPTPTAGDQMPSTVPLEADRIELLRAWIADGAKDN